MEEAKLEKFATFRERLGKSVCKSSLKVFSCGNSELNEWLGSHARRNDKSGASRVYLLTQNDEVCGYVAFTVGHIHKKDDPNKVFGEGMPQKIPIFLLGKLAVDEKYHGKGYAKQLIKAAFKSCLEASFLVGGVGILVDAVNEAVGFYQKYGFQALEFHDENSKTKKMFIPMNNLRANFPVGQKTPIEEKLEQLTTIHGEDWLLDRLEVLVALEGKEKSPADAEGEQNSQR